MNHLLILTSFLLLTLLCQINGQWFIIKKNYPSQVMNYPNPGRKRHVNENFYVDCSQPYSYQRSETERTAWLITCTDDQTYPTTMNYPLPIPSFNNDRRTLRSIPPYFNENESPFRRRLIDHFQRIYRKK